MSKVVCLCGFKGSGKDTAGEFLKEIAELDNKTVKKIAFADTIKDVLMETFQLKTQCDYDFFKRNIFCLSNESFIRQLNGRDILRSIGMGIRKIDGGYCFIRDANQKIVDNSSSTDLFIITDLRFENELEWIKLNNYPIVKILKDNCTSDGHISENGIPDSECDIIVYNNWTENHLFLEMETVYKRLFPDSKIDVVAREIK